MQLRSCYSWRATCQAVWQGRLQAVNKPQLMVTRHAPCCGRLMFKTSNQERIPLQPAFLLHGSSHGPSQRASSARGLHYSSACASRAQSRRPHSSSEAHGWTCNATRSPAGLAQRGSKPGSLHSVEGHGTTSSSSGASAATLDASDRRYIPWQLKEMALCHCRSVCVRPIACSSCRW